MKYFVIGLVNKSHVIIILATTIFSSGCAYSPICKEWEWVPDSSRNTQNILAREQLIRHKKRMEVVYKNNPKWRNTAVNDIIVVDYYDANGVRIGSAEVK